MSTPQRLPIVDSDDGVWGDILRQYLMKEHTNDDTDNAVNGGHKTITVTAGTTSAGTAPIKLTSGPLMTVSEAGAIEFLSDNLYFTQTTGSTRKKIALYDDSSGATGDIYYRNSSGYFTKLGIGSSGNVLTVSGGGIPSWSASAGNMLKSTYDPANISEQLVGLTATQTLTNKTLTSPKISQVLDSNGNTAFDVVPTASAVNYVRFLNAATSGTPKVTAAGTDTNINISIEPKGTGKFQIYATAGNTPTIQAQGADTNVDLQLRSKGTGTISSWQESGNAGWDINGTDTDVGFNFELQGAGTLQENGVDVVTVSGTQTLTNKTLTSPRMTNVNDANGNTVLYLQETASADSFVTIKNTNWQQAVISASSDAQSNVSLVLEPKGTGSLIIYSSAPTVFADGPNVDQNLNLTTKGAGTVQANGVDVTTISGTQTLTNKTIDVADNTLTGISKQVGYTTGGGNGAEDGADTWAKVCTVSNTATQFADFSIILAVNNKNTGSTGTGSAIISAHFRTNSTSTNPSVHVGILGAPLLSTLLGPDSFKIVSGGWGTDMELWVNKTANWGGFTFYELGRNNHGSLTITYEQNSAWQSTEPTGAVHNVVSNGVEAFGEQVVDVASTQTLTNKELTDPEINRVMDTNGNVVLGFNPQASAVNYVRLQNATAGSGQVHVAAIGDNADIALNLASKGSGKVKANSVEVATVSGTQTLTNKTLTNPTVNNAEVDYLKDTLGGTVIYFSPIASTVNYLGMYAGTTGSSPMIYAIGSDTDVPIRVRPKGAAAFSIYANTGNDAEVAAIGADADHNLNLTSKGTGTVQANGAEVVTVSGTQTLTNKTFDSTSNVVRIHSTSRKLIDTGLTVDPYANYSSPGPISPMWNDLCFNSEKGGSFTATKNGGAHGLTGTDYMFHPNGIATQDSSMANDDEYVVTVTTHKDFKYDGYFGIQMSGSWYAQDIKIEAYYSGGWTTIFDETDWGDRFAAVRYTTHGSNAITQIRYTLTNFTSTLLRIISLFATDYQSEILSAGYLDLGGGSVYGDVQITSPGTDDDSVVTISGTQTLTNKTLTTPVVSSFKDSNGNTAFDVGATASAVNYVRIYNAATSGTPSFTAAGSDTNISFAINPKGTGKFQIYASAGNTPTLQATGADTNVDLQLRSKGTGTISSWQESGNAGWDINGTDTDVGFNFELQGAGKLQENGVDVATTTGTQTLTNKTLTSPKVTSGNAPSTASSTGVAGQVEWDSGYVYVCIATDTWKRAALSTW